MLSLAILSPAHGDLLSASNVLSCCNSIPFLLLLRRWLLRLLMLHLDNLFVLMTYGTISFPKTRGSGSGGASAFSKGGSGSGCSLPMSRISGGNMHGIGMSSSSQRLIGKGWHVGGQSTYSNFFKVSLEGKPISPTVERKAKLVDGISPRLGSSIADILALHFSPFHTLHTRCN